VVHRAWYVDVAEMRRDLDPHLPAAYYNYGNDRKSSPRTEHTQTCWGPPTRTSQWRCLWRKRRRPRARGCGRQENSCPILADHEAIRNLTGQVAPASFASRPGSRSRLVTRAPAVIVETGGGDDSC